MNQRFVVGLRDPASHWCIAAHFSPDAADVAARQSWRHTYLQNFLENATMIRLLVLRGKGCQKEAV
ncbi:MAG: hypothetical protein ACJ73N_15780, partial [Bryobacteraceae bacterium]